MQPFNAYFNIFKMKFLILLFYTVSYFYIGSKLVLYFQQLSVLSKSVRHQRSTDLSNSRETNGDWREGEAMIYDL